MKFDQLRPILLLSLALLAGCGHEVSSPTQYYAVIERIEDVPGQHYTPERGKEPLSCIHLYLCDARGEHRMSRLGVFVFGLYRPAEFGEAGDWVAFQIADNLPLRDELWIEQLTGYRVLSHSKTVESRHTAGQNLLMTKRAR